MNPMNNKNRKTKFSQTKDETFYLPLDIRFRLISFLTLVTTCLLFAPEAMAVKAGEMKVGVTYLTELLDNNIIPLVLLTGTGAGAAVSYMKSSFTPLVIAICTAGGYGFAQKWISSVYTACI